MAEGLDVDTKSRASAMSSTYSYTNTPRGLMLTVAGEPSELASLPSLAPMQTLLLDAAVAVLEMVVAAAAACSRRAGEKQRRMVVASGRLRNFLISIYFFHDEIRCRAELHEPTRDRV